MKIQKLLLLIFIVEVVFCHNHKKCHFKKTPKDENILKTREQQSDRDLQSITTPQQIRIKYDVTQFNAIEDEDMKNWLTKTIVLTAKYFSDFIKVKQPINKSFKILNSSCHGYYTFSNQQMSKLYDSVDLIIFATFVHEPNESYVAYASGCQQDSTGRNIIGIVNFNTYYVNPGNIYEFQNQLQTTIHELFHVIVFDSDLYKYFISPTGKPYENSYFNDLTIKTPNVQKWVRDYYSCASLEGMPLENNGDSGSAGSHWEYMALQDDTMTSAGDDTLWSGVNNALLLDSGWYDVDLTYQDHLSWGRQKGCDFTKSYCHSLQNFPEFCKEEKKEGVTYSFHAKGTCRKTFWDDSCMYIDYGFNEMGRKDVCYDPQNNDASSPLKESYGENSRAFYSTLALSSSTETRITRCYNYKCTNNKSQIDITFGSETLSCKSDNEVLTSSQKEFNGELKCPVIKEFCDRQNECPLYCSSNGYCIAGKCICLSGFNGEGCQCKDGEVLIAGICQQCDSNCKTCSPIDTANCSVCNDGYFQQGSKCVQCNSPCKTCVDSADKCLSCISNYSYSSNKCEKSNDSNCDITQSTTQCQQCISGKGLDSSGKCTLTCDSNCNTCSLDSSKCTSCKGDFILFQNQCICQDGYYKNDQNKCVKCSTNCKVCKNGSTCDICVDLYSLDPATNKCHVCPIGSYLDANQCQKCSNNCKECGGTKDNCTSCMEDGHLSTSQGQSSCICNLGFFLQEEKDSSDFCSECSKGCGVCDNETTCKECLIQYKLNASKNVCDQCSEDFIMNSDGICDCKEGYYLSAQNKCVSCEIACNNCSGVKEKCEKEAMTNSNKLLVSLLVAFIILLL